MATPDPYEVPRIRGVDASLQMPADAPHHYLLAAGRLEHTIEADTTAVRLFGAFLVAQGFPQELKAIRRTHGEQYGISLSPPQASHRSRSAQNTCTASSRGPSTRAGSPSTRWPKWPRSPCPRESTSALPVVRNPLGRHGEP
jgi:hypothetical protein